MPSYVWAVCTRPTMIPMRMWKGKNLEVCTLYIYSMYSTATYRFVSDFIPAQQPRPSFEWTIFADLSIIYLLSICVYTPTTCDFSYAPTNYLPPLHCPHNSSTFPLTNAIISMNITHINVIIRLKM